MYAVKIYYTDTDGDNELEVELVHNKREALRTKETYEHSSYGLREVVPDLSYLNKIEIEKQSNFNYKFELNENGEESAFSVAADAEVVNKVAKDFMQSPKENTISLIEPTLLMQYLMSKGWKIFPRKRQDIKVLQIKKADGSFLQVTIPLTRALSDYGEALSIALETVAEAEDMDKKQLIAKLISPTVNNSAIE